MIKERPAILFNQKPHSGKYGEIGGD